MLSQDTALPIASNGMYRIKLQQHQECCEKSSMAKAGGPVLELCTLCEEAPFDSHQSSLQEGKASRAAGEPVYNSVIYSHQFASSPTRNTYCCNPRAHRDPAEEQLSPSKCYLIPTASNQSPSLSDLCPPLHHKTADDTSLSVKRDSFPVRSDHLPGVKNGVVLQAPDSCGLCYDGVKKATTHEAETQSMLACKQPMQVQQSKTITTFCRDAGSREGCVQFPEDKCHFTAKCDKTHCYGSHIQHNLSEETFAAYCHPQPLSAPSQLLPCPAGTEPICRIQRAVTPPPTGNHLTPPRLTSSVSDTDLDVKHQLQCCSIKCSWMSTPPPFSSMQCPNRLIRDEGCTNARCQAKTMTQDIGTMTVHKVLKDVGVQTVQTVTSHIFPQIFLSDESKSEIFYSQTACRDRDGGKRSGDAPKSPVKEVKWDAEGMTWEVYGASVDPEELGLAIQRHLELQIKETASHVNKMSSQNPSSTWQDRKISSQRKSSRMMPSIRAPTCCSCSTTAVD